MFTSDRPQSARAQVEKFQEYGITDGDQLFEAMLAEGYSIEVTVAAMKRNGYDFRGENTWVSLTARQYRNGLPLKLVEISSPAVASA